MERDKPKRGDLIAIDRGIYKHWALYVGSGYVIHLVRLEPEHAKAGCWSSCGRSVGEDEAKVEMKKLKKVADGDEYRINNHLDDQYKHHPIKKIVKDAKKLVGKRVPYDLVTHNCEHFAKLLRYGKPESQQVELKAAEAALALAAVAFAVDFAIATVAALQGS